jgi:antitoxin MazE
MEVPIIRIGNSKGIRLSKTVMERYQFKDKAEMILRQGELVLRPVHSIRHDWDEQFRQMHNEGEDHLLMGDLFEEDVPGDEEDWDEWK